LRAGGGAVGRPAGRPLDRAQTRQGAPFACSRKPVGGLRYADSAMADAHINPEMLRWAVQRVGASTDELAVAFKKPAEAIESWLAGETFPTFRQAQRLAKRLRIPFGFLFLAKAPSDQLPLPDFRRVHGQGRPTTSVDLWDVISDVLRKQDWYRDFRTDADEEPLPFVGAFALGAPVTDVVADISEQLSFEAAVRPQSQPSQFLRAFVRHVEALGVLVMRNGIVRQATNRALDVDEFRGFSIADPMAPVIFVNNADSNAAQAFTLAHELAHIWIGRGGISDADPTIKTEGNDDIEEYCNEVAAELLLPWAELQSRWTDRTDTVEDLIADVAREFHVSTVMVARQLWEHGAIDRDEFFRLYEVEKANWRRSESGSSGGNYYLSAPIRNSRLLTEAVLESVRASETSVRDASRLLGVKPANLDKLRESMGVG
jgi:Zn-dependent peptidase ImmA (M78 family)